MLLHNRIHSNRLQNSGYGGLWREKNGELVLNGAEFQF
jgi:hypothetical protein